MARTAVVLFNLGGPDSLDAVEPFLFNLFSDPAIIRLPRLFRHFIAKRISRRRAPIAQEIYRQMGGKSPIVEQTKAQAEALEAALSDLGEVRVFTTMRYWHPRSDVAAMEVKRYAPDRVMLLPLYPQFSTTTTKSSLVDWYRAAKNIGLTSPQVTSSALCCYATSEGLITAQSELITPLLSAAAAKGPVRLLLSAHGLPESIVKSGDPYAWQVEQTAAGIVDNDCKCVMKSSEEAAADDRLKIINGRLNDKDFHLFRHHFNELHTSIIDQEVIVMPNLDTMMEDLGHKTNDFTDTCAREHHNETKKLGNILGRGT